MTPQPLKLLNKRNFILLCLLIIVSALVWVIYGYGFIEITVKSTDAKALQYSLTTNDSSQPLSPVPNTKIIRKFVRRGEYEATVTSETGSYFSAIHSRGMLSTTKIEASLQTEMGREFIGNSPQSCSSVVNMILVSFSCGGQISQAYIHVPSTSALPTYTKRIGSPYEGRIEGALTINNKVYFFLKAPATAHDQAPHGIYLLGDDYEITLASSLDDLDTSSTYDFFNYKNGFIAVSNTSYDMEYFDTLKSKPQKVSVPTPLEGKGLAPYGVSFGNSLIVKLYTDQKTRDRSEEDSSGPIRSKSAVVVYDSNSKQSNAYHFDTTYTDVRICGSKKLCAISDEKLFVFDINGKKQRLLYSIHGIKNMIVNKERLLIARDDGIIDFDADNRSGHRVYSFGEYSFCGFEKSNFGLVLCVQNPRSEKSTLLLSDNIDSKTIDKQVLGFIKSPDIKAISVYKNIIYISPSYGPYTYWDEKGNLGYNKERKNKVNKAINELIKQSSIASPFEIINPLE